MAERCNDTQDSKEMDTIYFLDTPQYLQEMQFAYYESEAGSERIFVIDIVQVCSLRGADRSSVRYLKYLS